MIVLLSGDLAHRFMLTCQQERAIDEIQAHGLGVRLDQGENGEQ